MSYRFDWERGIVNRNYHVLRTLEKQGVFDSIISVDFLPFSIKKKAKTIIRTSPWKRNSDTIYRSLSTRIDHKKGSSTYHVTTTDLLKLPHALEKAGITTDEVVLWSYTPFIAEQLDVFPNAQFIFDAVDNWVEHPSYHKYTARLEEAYKQIGKRADIIFTVSEGLVDFFNKREQVFYIPNGVDVNHFKEASCNTKFISDTYLSEQDAEKRKRIGYHGIIQSRVNISVFDYLSEQHPEYDFIIAGPVWKEMEKDMDKIKDRSNVYTIGEVPYKDLPSLLACFDATIIPHKVDTFTQTMNPLKIYEYLAAGLPIVSTAVAGADQFQDLISLAVSPKDFSQKINKVLRQDTEELHQRRTAMATEHSWDTRIALMLEIINKHQ